MDNTDLDLDNKEEYTLIGKELMSPKETEIRAYTSGIYRGCVVIIDDSETIILGSYKRTEFIESLRLAQDVADIFVEVDDE